MELPATSADSSADDPDGARREWYGWQVFVADVASFSLMVVGMSLEQDGGMAAFSLGLAGYALGPMIIHAKQERVGVGAASIGLRVSTPFVIGISAIAAAGCDEGSWCLEEFAVGFLVGMGLAAVIDAAALTHRRVQVPTPPPVVATLAPTRGGATIALTGAL